jgi:hypothetical protein
MVCGAVFRRRIYFISVWSSTYLLPVVFDVSFGPRPTSPAKRKNWPRVSRFKVVQQPLARLGSDGSYPQMLSLPLSIQKPMFLLQVSHTSLETTAALGEYSTPPVGDAPYSSEQAMAIEI